MHLIQKGRTDFYTNKKASSNVALPQMEKDSDTPKGARNIDNASAKVNNNSESGKEIRIANTFAHFHMRRTAPEGRGPPSYFPRICIIAHFFTHSRGGHSSQPSHNTLARASYYQLLFAHNQNANHCNICCHTLVRPN